jgi:hypothetical protein
VTIGSDFKTYGILKMTIERDGIDLDGALIIERAHKSLANGLEVVSLELDKKVTLLHPFESPIGYLQSRVYLRLAQNDPPMNPVEHEVWSHWMNNTDKPLPQANDPELVQYVEAFRYMYPEHEPQPEGPCDGYGWINLGQRIQDEMKELPWRMVNYLWSLKGKSCKWEQLAEPVYGDEEYVIDGEAIPSLRREANRFFDRHGIPWKVTVQKQTRAKDSQAALIFTGFPNSP